MKISLDWSRWGDRLLNAALVGTFVLIVLLIHRSVYSQFAQRPELRIQPQSFEAAAQPEWSKPLMNIHKTLAQRIPAGASWYDNDLTTSIAVQLRQDPWIRKVNRVERGDAGALQVSVELRRPVAMLRIGEAYYLADREAIRLPGRFDIPPALPIPVIPVSGIDETIPAVGQRWKSDKAREAVALCNLLLAAGVPGSVPVREIQVEDSERSETEAVRMTVFMGEWVPVYWGDGIIDPTPTEHSFQRKLENLRAVTQTWKGLRGVASVDLTQYTDQALVRMAEGGPTGPNR